MNAQTWRTLVRRPAVHILAVAFAGLLAYSNTFHVPFQLDESFYLRANPLIGDRAEERAPGSSVGAGGGSLVGEITRNEMDRTIRQRYIGFLTFAWNYRLHGFSVEGYHAVNIAIHLLNAALLYALVAALLRTPVLAHSVLQGVSGPMAFVPALFFAVHPLQTEAVTYIMQRLASLAAFFYLLSVTSYVRSRIATTGTARTAFFVLSLGSGLCAMKTKEIAFTLPFVITAGELLFFRGDLRKRMAGLVPVLLLLPVIPLAVLTGGGEAPPGVASTAAQRMEYLFTQFTVILSYLRLLVLPVGQSFVHDHPVHRAFAEPPVVFSSLFLLVLLAVAVVLAVRARRGDGGLALPAFGVAWFLGTLSVESGIVPLPMIMCEYRVYLPSAGFFIAVLSGGAYLILTYAPGWMRGAGAAVLVVAPLLLGSAAYARNGVWATTISLWEDTVRKNPSSAAARNALAGFYLEAGRPDDALREYASTLTMGFEHPKVYNNMGLAYFQLGRYAEAAEHYQAALRSYPQYAEALYGLANVFARQNRFDDAVREYEAVLHLQRDHVEARNNLAGVYVLQGKYEKAEQELMVVLRLAPDLPDVRENLALITELLRRQRSGEGPGGRERQGR